MITAALIITILLTLLAIFQLALVCGAPLGKFAWGGQHKVLPPKLRIGSGIAIVLYAISRSKPERYSMTPVAAILTICFLVLTLA